MLPEGCIPKSSFFCFGKDNVCMPKRKRIANCSPKICQNSKLCAIIVVKECFSAFPAENSQIDLQKQQTLTTTCKMWLDERKMGQQESYAKPPKNHKSIRKKEQLMAFCKYSIDMLANNVTQVDNIFLTNYLPFADPQAVRVYLYGLYKCQDSSAKDNTLERFATELHLSQDDVEKFFTYWQEQGLVQIINVIPFEVRFLPLTDVLSNNKKYNAKKYENFNVQAQEILRGRMITPNEYREYYDIIERLHMEKEAMLMIIDYCVKYKNSDKIGYAYITTVAKEWANQKITTAAAVKEKIFEMDSLKLGIDRLLKALSLKRSLSMDEFDLFKKWIVSFGFDENVVIYVAGEMKKRKDYRDYYVFQALDKKLEKYFSNKLFTVEDIQNFEQDSAQSQEIAKNVVKNLGLYYENLEPVVDTYILPWLGQGFSKEMLAKVSNYCFKSGIRTLDGMGKVLTKFQKLGILSENALDEYFSGVLSTDKKIKEILENVGLSRNVNQFDRDKYKVWSEVWKMSDELLSYACTLALGKDQPMQYLASILSSFHDKNITNVEDAKNSYQIAAPKSQKPSFSTGRSYTKEEMNALFQSIDEIEV